MTVRLRADGVIALEGVCAIEDAETLQGLLLAHPDAPVDWRSCRSVHTAVIQILLVVRPPLQGPPADAFLRTHVAPLLQR